MGYGLQLECVGVFFGVLGLLALLRILTGDFQRDLDAEGHVAATESLGKLPSGVLDGDCAGTGSLGADWGWD